MQAARQEPSTSARVARLLQLDRGRLRTLLLAAGVLFGRPTWTSLAIGYAIILPGAALHLWTKGCLRIGAEVTTSGPYRWVRNPFYLATLVVDAGLCVVVAEPLVALAYWPLWLVVHLLTIRREERALAQFFGARYEIYRARVPRLVPWRGPVGGLPPSAGFSWDAPQLALGMEYARVVRTLAAPLVVVVGHAVVEHGAQILSAQHAGEMLCAVALAALFALDRALVLRSRRRKARGGSVVSG